MKHYDVIVIGSGIGGLAAAAILTQRGKKVLLLEKNKLYGGRLSSYQRDGFVVDVGVHVISTTNKGPLAKALAMAGIENDLEFTSVRPVSSFQGKRFLFPKDLKNYIPEEDYQAVLRFVEDCRTCPEEVSNKYDEMSVRDLLRQYTQNKFADACVGRVASIYFCSPIWACSAGEFIRCFRREAEARASGYPQGGCGAITRKFLDGIRAQGGEIRNLTPVKEILVQNGRAVGVRLENEDIYADMIVSNADIKETVALAGADSFPPDYLQYVEDLKYSWSGCVLRIGLDAEITDIKMMSQIGATDMDEYASKLYDGSLPEELNLFIVVPSNFSDTVAPKGRQIVNVATSVPTDLPAESVERLRGLMLETLERYVPGVQEHASWIEYSGVPYFRQLGGENGAHIGIGQAPGQTGRLRPSSKLPVEGLYCVGGAAGGSGVGIELCLNSAIDFIEAYC